LGKSSRPFFRISTVPGGKELGLCGCSMNTERGTVIGRLEGSSDKVEDVKKWLKCVGSWRPKIENIDFHKEWKIDTTF
jgi:acylphosphatase